MGTPIEDLRPGASVVVNAVVDRLLAAPVHGIDAVTVRLDNAQATGRHDEVVRVTMTADKVTEAGRLLHFSAEHARLAEWLLDERPADVAERMSDTGAVDLTIELLRNCEGLWDAQRSAGRVLANASRPGGRIPLRAYNLVFPQPPDIATDATAGTLPAELLIAVAAVGQDGTACTQPSEPVACLLYTSPSPRDRTRSRMPSSA